MAEVDPPVSALPTLLQLLGRSFEEGDTQRVFRSDVLRPLWAPMGGLATLAVVLFAVKAPLWAPLATVVAIGALLVIYLGVYLFCLWRRPDSLRSERFELTKYAITQHLFGDNQTGLIEGAPVRAVPAKSGTDPLADASGTVK
jgi:hypothetical protein